MAKYLRENGILAEVMNSATNMSGATAGTLKRFSAGEVQVICATKGALPLFFWMVLPNVVV
jgi:hypothetical protein